MRVVLGVFFVPLALHAKRPIAIAK